MALRAVASLSALSDAEVRARVTAGSASFLQNGLTNAVDGSEDHLISVRHAATVGVVRRDLPCLVPNAPLPALEAPPDPGYGPDAGQGGEASDESENDGSSGEEDAGGGTMRRIILERDDWLDGLASGAAASGGSAPRGFVGPPGQRRSTRRLHPVVPFTPR